MRGYREGPRREYLEGLGEEGEGENGIILFELKHYIFKQFMVRL